MTYKVKLESFEGPLDLLLFLIKKNEVDIYDIPISMITHQYLEYLEIIQMLDLEAASDFMLLASTLIQIKAKMLLPKPVFEEEEELIEDPRQELIYRLLEYKRFKTVAEDLGDKEEYARKLFTRGSFKIIDGSFEEDLEPEQPDVSLFDLVSAFKRVIEKNKKVTIHRVIEINVTLEEKVNEILEYFESHEKTRFEDLFDPNDDRLVLIVTFIAVLELIKKNIIRAEQNESFGTIHLFRLNGIKTT